MRCEFFLYDQNKMSIINKDINMRIYKRIDVREME